MPLPTPHLEKLNATLANDKLPPADEPRIKAAIQRYGQWIAGLTAVTGTPQKRIQAMVALLNEYRLFIDVELVFDSPQDFLYRQKGQLKLDNSVIEEFLPYLVEPAVLPEIAGHEVVVGPTTCFSSVYFSTSLEVPVVGGGLEIRSKDQDFAISKKLFLKASHDPVFPDPESVTKETHIGFVVSECKTNLDKTMFQEACATAHDVKAAVAGARYYLLCEWLDMTPLSTAPTDIDEILLLRKAKRINSNVRAKYATYAGRQANRAAYQTYLTDNPFRPEVFKRFVDHIRGILRNEAPVESDVLARGYF
ncbi:MAG TPA: Bpu10I family restriction endonuclease [Gemmataceae bacterium]|nr:Bpu10I family restriction endonuclease [Gemmataceae bacterium]